MLELDLDRAADKYIRKLIPKHARQIKAKIIALLSDPNPPDAFPLHGFSYMRADSGEYRIIYRASKEVLTVRLIGKRNDDDVYRRLDRLGG